MRQIFIKSDNQEDYEPIPKWAECFIHAGKNAAAIADADCQKIVIGFSLPTRVYATLFFLLGYEAWNIKNQLKNQEGNRSHFQYLSECEQDEALLILVNKRWKRCWFKGIETVAGEEYIKVDVPCAKQYSGFIPISSIFKLRKAVDPERNVATNQIGFEMTGFDSFSRFYDKKGHEIIQLLTEGEHSYVVFGIKATIEKEIKFGKIYCRSTSNFEEISFQHILRFNNFMTDFDLSRGTILSSKESGDIPSYATVPRAIIYDGSLAYLNRQGTLQNNMEIIFLDRTEPQFSNACSELMTRYYDREDDVKLFNETISSFEFIAFRE